MMEKKYKIFAMKITHSANGEENYSFLVQADTEGNAFLKAKDYLIKKYNVDATAYHISVQ